MIYQKLQQYWYIPLGIFLGTLVIFASRTVYYLVEGLKPNMHPGIFVLFAPIVSLLLIMVATAVEAVIVKLFGKGSFSPFRCFVLGISYSLISLIILGRFFVIIPMVINPLVVHLFFRYKKSIQ